MCSYTEIDLIVLTNSRNCVDWSMLMYREGSLEGLFIFSHSIKYAQMDVRAELLLQIDMLEEVINMDTLFVADSRKRNTSGRRAIQNKLRRNTKPWKRKSVRSGKESQNWNQVWISIIIPLESSNHWSVSKILDNRQIEPNCWMLSAITKTNSITHWRRRTKIWTYEGMLWI